MGILDRFRDEQVTLIHPTYRITRVRQVGPTALLNGGAAPCWEVRGVKVRD